MQLPVIPIQQLQQHEPTGTKCRSRVAEQKRPGPPPRPQKTKIREQAKHCRSQTTAESCSATCMTGMKFKTAPLITSLGGCNSRMVAAYLQALTSFGHPGNSRVL